VLLDDHVLGIASICVTICGPSSSVSGFGVVGHSHALQNKDPKKQLLDIEPWNVIMSSDGKAQAIK
jgi:hypothetical protein